MKIAVTSIGTDLNADVDPRFGRAEGFVMVDTESGEIIHLKNDQNLNALKGGGIQSAEKIISMGMEVLLTGHCGLEAFRRLQAAGVDVYLGVVGNIEKAIEKFKKGELSKAKFSDGLHQW